MRADRGDIDTTEADRESLPSHAGRTSGTVASGLSPTKTTWAPVWRGWLAECGSNEAANLLALFRSHEKGVESLSHDDGVSEIVDRSW